MRTRRLQGYAARIHPQRARVPGKEREPTPDAAGCQIQMVTDKRRGRPRFDLGQVVITSNAQRQLDETSYQEGLRRHHRGDWGELCEEDRQANERALDEGARLLSAYRDVRETKYWIITEADRSATTVLLPEDY